MVMEVLLLLTFYEKERRQKAKVKNIYRDHHLYKSLLVFFIAVKIYLFTFSLRAQW